MRIVLTNDDGYDAPGLLAAFRALRDLGPVHVVAPRKERSACSHTITLKSLITVERIKHGELGAVFAVDGTPADCVRLAFAALVEGPIGLVVSGINAGANAGVDTFYSGTIAGAREAAILGIRAIAVSQAVRSGVTIDWSAAADVTARLVRELIDERLPGAGFWSINLPAPIPEDAASRVRRVPVADHPMPMTFDRFDEGDRSDPCHPSDPSDARVMQFGYGASYWLREVTGPNDYSTIRDGDIAVTAIPLFGRF